MWDIFELFREKIWRYLHRNDEPPKEEPVEQPIEQPLTDIDHLWRILWWECRGEPERGQTAVANVVINRSKDKRWPNTIQGVIEQKSQFTPVENPAYHTKDISGYTNLRDVAQRALTGLDKVVADDYFYFSVGAPRKYAQDMIKIGNHWFGRDKRDKPLRQTLKVTDPVTKGADVKTFQWLVTKLGFDCGKIDGVYGLSSREACVAYQKHAGLNDDGVCGTDTWNALDVENVENPTWVSRLMEWGFAQMIELKGLTFAVKQFQSAMGLSVDGVVGSQTLSALNGTIIKPRIFEPEIRCQCNKYCDGYPLGRGMGQGVLILAERIFRECEKVYPGTKFYAAGRATDPSNNGSQIAGGYRCEKWNKERGGAARSKHKECIALDVWGRKDGESDSEIRKHIETVALKLNIKGGVGYGAHYIVHIDTRGRKARWAY